MPFLRRRGNMASDGDMRRRSLFDSLTITKQAPSRFESASNPSVLTPVAEHVPVHRSAPDVPAPCATSPNNDWSLDPTGLASVTTDESTARPPSPSVQAQGQRHRRFSMLRFRNASDSQLAAKAKLHASTGKAPPVPRPPEIITTAPTTEVHPLPKRPSRLELAGRYRESGDVVRDQKEDEANEKTPPSTMGRTSLSENRQSSLPAPKPGDRANDKVGNSSRPGTSNASTACPANTTSALAGNRPSVSSMSNASSGERFMSSTTTTTVFTTTTFFKLGRRKKQCEALFPLGHLQPRSQASMTMTQSNDSKASLTVPTPDSAGSSPPRSRTSRQQTPTPSRCEGTMFATPPATRRGLFGKPAGSPATAFFQPNSGQSGNISPMRAQLEERGRSPTTSSRCRKSPRASVDGHLAMPVARTSTSTGRKSFGDLLGLRGLRPNPDVPAYRKGAQTPNTPVSDKSKNNSLQLPRDSIPLPDRREDDTPAKYLERLVEVMSRSVIAAVMAKGTDAFSQSVLRSYMRSFRFFEDPMDMAIRKLLMEADLPKETQQIDRFLQAFANRYHECNPGIYASPDQAYFIAFSLLILHTDVFNPNNKHKMQKADYLKNTRGEGIYHEILDVFYDNITYTPFIHVEDDFDINGERIMAHKTKRKSLFPNNSTDPAKWVAKEPIDPYTLLIDNNLDILRPNLKEVMHLEDPYNYLGTSKSLDVRELQKTFFKTGILQIISARSRPDAFMTEKTVINPDAAHPGIVDIKITKVGLLWRKEAKKKKTRSRWQEWGVILTGAQLYFFRNTPWIKTLMHQYDEHVRKGNDGDPCVFKPPLEHFKPDALMSTDGAVALVDSTYKKHKHAFVYVRHGGFEEILLAEDEAEMNDWLAKLNYAAAFRTSGVRMRGVVGGKHDGQTRRPFGRMEADSDRALRTPTGDFIVSRGRIDPKMRQDILEARRDVMLQKVSANNLKLEQAERHLETQLRNSRHLQIMAPIQSKTRDQMLLSAAKMAAQLKWTRMEISKLKCHRDILLLDLDEERQALGPNLPPRTGSMTKSEVEMDKMEEAEAAAQGLPSESSISLEKPPPKRDSSPTVSDAASSSRTDVFQTPPTSATTPTFRREDVVKQPVKQPVKQLVKHPGMSPVSGEARQSSISSTVSSNLPTAATPPRAPASSSTSPEKPELRQMVGQDEVDADERGLLRESGLIGAGNASVSEHKTASSMEMEQASDVAAERAERNNFRRSLQRTLREGAGHLSHHRSRRGKDSVSGGLTDDAFRDAPEVLSRGSGSFVVHGKKASVITFGDELQLQTLSPEERNLQRRQREDVRSPTLPQPEVESVDASDLKAESGTDSDFRAVLTAAGLSGVEREHRESTASASTATARSFRELHRKFRRDSAAARAIGISLAGGLAVPPDEDSDAAVSFSDGRRTPLPPIDAETEGDGESGSLRTDFSLPSSKREGDVFSTPGLIVSPRDHSPARGDAQESLASRPVQAVSA